MRISKVNHNPTSGKTTIEYGTVENEGKDHLDHVLHTGDEPHRDLLAALDALKPEVEGLAELPEGYLDAVRGVTLHRDDDDPEVYTVTYTATKALDKSKSPLVVNTPAVEPANRSKIETVLKRAKEFIEGRRAQGELPMSTPHAGAHAPEAPSLAQPEKPAKSRKPAEV